MLEKKVKITDGFVKTRKWPVNITDKDRVLFEKTQEVNLAAKYIYYLENVKVTPESVVFSGLRILRQFLIYPYHKRVNNKYLFQKEGFFG